MELINLILTTRLGAKLLSIDEMWRLILANDKETILNRYAWIPINVERTVVVYKIYLIEDGKLYNILLSQKRMSRVEVKEDYSAGTFSI